MARRTIEVNPFSSKSINSAIMSLRREKKRLTEDFKNAFMNKLGLELSGLIQLELGRQARWFNEDVDAEYEVQGDTIVLRAYGESVAFVEFGAGVYADDGEFVAMQFYPGSWSEQNAKTYQAWVEAGMPGEYQWDQEPAHSFDTIIRNLDSYVREAADYAYKEVYG